MRGFLVNLVKRRASTEGQAWFEKALKAAADSDKSPNTFLGYYSAASRKLGKQALRLNDSERRELVRLNSDLPLDHWGIDEAARAALLLSVVHLDAEGYTRLVQQCYELGDSREQQSWLRALSLLPHCERFVATAIDACRTNIIPLFEAMACENPYPMHYFPELNFNQMVLKSLFNSIALRRIIGLESRFNAELSRMADDYVSEREAAGREVPPDIWLVVAPEVQPEKLQRIYRYLHHENRNHRYWAAVGLGHRRDSESLSQLKKRALIEADPKVKEALEAALG